MVLLMVHVLGWPRLVAVCTAVVVYVMSVHLVVPPAKCICRVVWSLVKCEGDGIEG
jgi:hypothetical protein